MMRRSGTAKLKEAAIIFEIERRLRFLLLYWVIDRRKLYDGSVMRLPLHLKRPSVTLFALGLSPGTGRTDPRDPEIDQIRRES
jgi:hypothetical protein